MTFRVPPGERALVDRAMERAGYMSEDELLTAITEAATLYGWRWHHVRRSDKAIQQGHPGFPDLVLVRKGTLLFLELKGKGGRATEAQKDWINDLWNNQVEARFVWPDDLDTVLEQLR